MKRLLALALLFAWMSAFAAPNVPQPVRAALTQARVFLHGEAMPGRQWENEVVGVEDLHALERTPLPCTPNAEAECRVTVVYRAINIVLVFSASSAPLRRV